MTQIDRALRRQDDAARQELRRLVSDGRAPSDVAAEAFGSWQKWIAPLRATYYSHGPGACRKLFLEQNREHPALGVLLSADPQPEPERRLWWTWDHLNATRFPEPVWVVPDVIPSGLVPIGGRPKIGKSWLTLQLDPGPRVRRRSGRGPRGARACAQSAVSAGAGRWLWWFWWNWSGFPLFRGSGPGDR